MDRIKEALGFGSGSAEQSSTSNQPYERQRDADVEQPNGTQTQVGNTYTSCELWFDQRDGTVKLSHKPFHSLSCL